MSDAGAERDPGSTQLLEPAFVLFIDLVRFSPRPTTEQLVILSSLDRLIEHTLTQKGEDGGKRPVQISIGDGYVFVFEKIDTAAYHLGLDLVAASSKTGPELRAALHYGLVSPLQNANGSQNFIGEGMNTCARVATLAGTGDYLVSEEAVKALVQLGLPSEKFGALREESVKHGQAIKVAPVLGEEAEISPAKNSHRLRKLASRLRDRAKKRGHAHVASVDTILRRLIEIRRDAAFGLVLIAVAFLAHFGFQQTDPGQRFEIAGYDWLLGFAQPPPGPIPVTLVDFRERINLPKPGPEDQNTDLGLLGKLVGKIANQAPCSIGIDLDFGPQPRREDPSSIFYLDEGTPFMEDVFKVNQSTGVPIHFATLMPAGGETSPLSDTRMESFAAHCYIPREVRTGLIFMFGPIPTPGPPFPGLPDAVMEDYAKSHHASLATCTWLRTPYGDEELTRADRSNSRELLSQLRVVPPEYFLNYVDKTALLAESIVVDRQLNLLDVSGNLLDAAGLYKRLNGKAVIIGSTTTATDFHTEPRSDQKVGGAVVLALAADSRLHAPLFELTIAGRLVIHVLSGLIVLGTILGIRLAYLTEPKDIASGRLSLTLTILTVVATMAMGILFVRYASILWSDSFIVVLMLLLHPRVEHSIEHAVRSSTASLASYWKRMIFRGGN